jgi:hypothetical protein
VRARRVDGTEGKAEEKIIRRKNALVTSLICPTNACIVLSLFASAVSMFASLVKPLRRDHPVSVARKEEKREEKNAHIVDRNRVQRLVEDAVRS